MDLTCQKDYEISNTGLVIEQVKTGRSFYIVNVAWWYTQNRDNLGEQKFNHPVIMAAHLSA